MQGLHGIPEHLEDVALTQPSGALATDSEMGLSSDFDDSSESGSDGSELGSDGLELGSDEVASNEIASELDSDEVPSDSESSSDEIALAETCTKEVGNSQQPFSDSNTSDRARNEVAVSVFSLPPNLATCHLTV
jgi:hypothetical protein